MYRHLRQRRFSSEMFFKTEKKPQGLMGCGDSRESKRGRVKTGKNISEATEANFKRQEKKKGFWGDFFLGIFLAGTQKSCKSL